MRDFIRLAAPCVHGRSGVLGHAWGAWAVVAVLGVHGRAWAGLGVLERAWACLGVLGRAWACGSLFPTCNYIPVHFVHDN
jgi:hypothetical protein